MMQLKPIVEKVLADNLDARNDDHKLVFLTYKELGFNCQINDGAVILTLKESDLALIPAFESITRLRRQIQNVELRYLPTWGNVLVKRNFTEETVRAIFGESSNVFQNYIFIKTEGARYRQPHTVQMI